MDGTVLQESSPGLVRRVPRVCRRYVCRTPFRQSGRARCDWAVRGRVSVVDGGYRSRAHPTSRFPSSCLALGRDARLSGVIYGKAGGRHDLRKKPAVEGVSWDTVGQFYLGDRLLGSYFTNYTYFMHRNVLGSENGVTNWVGSENGEELFNPLGVPWATVGSPVIWTFAGFEHGHTDIMQWPGTFREYDPNKGRWLSPDPLAGDISNPQSLNRYTYVLNQPTTLIDPLGLCSDLDFGYTDENGNFVLHHDVGPCPVVLQPWLAFTSGNWTCSFFGINCGWPSPASGRGSAGGTGGSSPAKPPAPPPGLLSKFKNAVCSVLPEGRVMSINGSIGGIGGQNGSVSVVINYASGQVSGFATGGLQVGWNGLAQASVSVGFIYGALRPNNEGYSGTFTTGSFSGATFGGFGSFGNGVQVYGGSLGTSLTGVTGTLSRTVTSRPFQFGKTVGSFMMTPLDVVLSVARQGACQ
jgi:RHS repeat-associated protein